MSMFLPDGAATQPPSGVADITPASSETSSADIALMQRVLSAASRNPNLIPQDFMSYMLDWIQTQRLQIPLKQVVGYQSVTQSSRVHLNSNLTVASSSLRTIVSWAAAADFDYGGLWDGASKFVIKTPGKYVVGASVSWSNGAGGGDNGTGQRYVTIKKNDVSTSDTGEVSSSAPNASNNFNTDHGTVTLLDLAESDFLAVGVVQNSGANRVVEASARSNFWVARVGS